MTNPLPYLMLTTLLFLIPNLHFGQAPDLGTTSSFALFTAVGEFSNNGATVVMGDVGTNAGAFTGFPPGKVNGATQVENATSAQAAIDVQNAFMQLSAVPCGPVLGVNLGNNQTLTPDVYCIGAATTLNGDLILDGQCDPDAIFIIKIDGALSTSLGSQVLLINSASLCNVYWQINGAVDLGENSVFRGTIVANGAISLYENATLFGRGLSQAGAIDLRNNFVDVDMQPTASLITAEGDTTFCEGESVVLSGNCGGTWSTGATSESITVTTSGTYFVTTNNDCGSAISNTILITVIPPPICTITGEDFFCTGESTELCTPPGGASYLWSTGENTNCISVDMAGTYSVTVTDVDGCFSVCEILVTENPLPICTISGDDFFCTGGSTELCTPPGAASYLWSTGENTNCITVDMAGIYSVTVTDEDGCFSVCEILVTENPLPICTISGDDFFCIGGSTELCTPPGAASYLWSTGENTNCITVDMAGIYSVTVTGEDGCFSVCEILVNENPLPICTISGDDFFCIGGSTELCTPPGAASYLWSTGENTNCITVDMAGIYSVTVTDEDGCFSVCEILVNEETEPICMIIGNDCICPGETTQLCADSSAVSYL